MMCVMVFKGKVPNYRTDPNQYYWDAYGNDTLNTLSLRIPKEESVELLETHFHFVPTMRDVYLVLIDYYPDLGTLSDFHVDLFHRSQSMPANRSLQDCGCN